MAAHRLKLPSNSAIAEPFVVESTGTRRGLRPLKSGRRYPVRSVQTLFHTSRRHKGINHGRTEPIINDH
jgi:hypothetical protein